jgi:ATP-dependent DNA ligase
MPDKVLADLRRRLDPLARKAPPLNALPPRKTRFGSPLVLSRVHWVEPRLVAEITYLTWTADNLCGRRFTLAFARTSRPIRCGVRARARNGPLQGTDSAFVDGIRDRKAPRHCHEQF